ncbi:hypothetical protein D1872_271880 [compost metagenome]
MPFNEPVQYRDLERTEILGFVDNDVVEGQVPLDFLNSGMQVKHGRQILVFDLPLFQIIPRFFIDSRRYGRNDLPVRAVPFFPAKR